MSKKKLLIQKRYYNPKGSSVWGDTLPESYKKQPIRTFSEVLKHIFTQKYAASTQTGYLNLLPKGLFMQEAIISRSQRIMMESGALQYRFTSMFSSDDEAIHKGLYEKFSNQIMSIESSKENSNIHLKYASDPLLFKYFSNKHVEVPHKIYSPDYFFRATTKGELKHLINPREFFMLDFHFFYELNDFDSYIDAALFNKEILRTIISIDDWYLNIDTNKDFFTKYEVKILEMLDLVGVPAIINITSERTHYYSIQNQYIVDYFFGNKTQLSNLQFDQKNGELFQITSKDTNKPVSVIHGTVFGRVEKIIALVFGKQIEKFVKTGEKPILPIWLTPIVVRVILLNTNPKTVEFSETVSTFLIKSKCRFDIDKRKDIKLGSKIKSAEKDWIPYIITIGDLESENKTVSVRDRESGNISTLSIEKLCKKLEPLLKDNDFNHQTTPRIYLGEDIY